MSGTHDGTWWRDAVVYQVYPRSFQDADGDGEGDLRGIAARLDHVRELGADAIWLSPVYPSPMADGGYDVADYEQIDPRFGTLADADALIAAAHDRGLRLLMDVVPCHTSIEHPWFREHPERYVWSDRDGPANNWRASFGGPAWSRDPVSGRWYLHSFYPEQPDLDWRQEDVGAAIGRALRFWLARGVDGFRLDAIDRLLKDPQLRDDPPASAPPLLPEHADVAALQSVHSRNAPDIGAALELLRRAAGDETLLVGEVYLPSAQLAPYLEHVDSAFAFELLHAPWEAGAIRAAIASALDAGGSEGRIAWVLSNHDFPRLPDRVGVRNTRAAALLALTLPGAVFVYQGDEIGMADGPGGDPPHDRAGPRPPPPPDALGRRAAARRLHGGGRDALASRDRGRRRRRRAAVSRRRLGARAVPRPDRAAALAGRRPDLPRGRRRRHPRLPPRRRSHRRAEPRRRTTPGPAGGCGRARHARASSPRRICGAVAARPWGGISREKLSS